MPRQSKDTVAVLGIDIGKNVFHLIGLDRGAPSYCARSCRADSWKHGSPTCHPA